MQEDPDTRAAELREHAGASEGLRATLFDDGAALFEETMDAIHEARERVWIETFLFTPDETGCTTRELDADAARRGCEVILRFDQLGSHVTSLGFYRPLEEAGGRVAIFNPLPPWRRYGRRLGSFCKYRDHRKIVVIDDVAFFGGHNSSRSYGMPGTTAKRGPPSVQLLNGWRSRRSAGAPRAVAVRPKSPSIRPAAWSSGPRGWRGGRGGRRPARRLRG